MSTTAANTGSIAVPVQNDGTISVAAGNDLSISTLSNLVGTTLTGGTYNVASGGALSIQGQVLTDGAAISLAGTGQLSDGSGDGLRDLAAVSAAGSITLSGGRQLTVSGALSSAGTIAVKDTSKLTLTTGALTLTAGQLTGSGTVTATSVANTGATVAPGNAANGSAILSITGTYSQGAAATLAVDANGSTVGTQYDRLAVSGAVTLDGTLSVATGFTPVLGLTFDVLTGASRSGQFATYAGMTAGSSALYTPTYGATFARLTMTQLPAISVGNVSVTEGNSGTAVASFPVTLSSSPSLAVTVHWATADGTAVAPGDYTAACGNAHVHPGPDLEDRLGDDRR